MLLPGLRGGLRLRGGAPTTGWEKKLSTKERKLYQDLSRLPSVLSAAQPGLFKGDEAKYVPTVTLTEDGVEVVVKHGMEQKEFDEVHAQVMKWAEDPMNYMRSSYNSSLRYVDNIWIVDEDTGEVLAAKNLHARAGETKISIKGNFTDRCLTPYSMWNTHEVWRGEYIGTPKAKVEVVEEIMVTFCQ